MVLNNTSCRQMNNIISKDEIKEILINSFIEKGKINNNSLNNVVFYYSREFDKLLACVISYDKMFTYYKSFSLTEEELIELIKAKLSIKSDIRIFYQNNNGFNIFTGMETDSPCLYKKYKEEKYAKLSTRV